MTKYQVIYADPPWKYDGWPGIYDGMGNFAHKNEYFKNSYGTVMKENPSIDWYNSVEVDALDNLKLDFAVAVEHALTDSGKKRVDLAKELHVSSARITKVLRGDSNLTMEIMHKIAKAFGHTIHIHLEKLLEIAKQEGQSC